MTTILSPLDLTQATQTGSRLFRKQILRKGTINYKGQRIAFDDAFLQDVVRSFKRGAYDQVPFVFADPDNRHTMDPERFRGEIQGLELTSDGVDAIVKATNDGAKVIRKNPRLGVSARIVQGLEKSDGRKFRRAIQHVLATMDPRLEGMRPWEAVDLSDDDEDDEVIDLTAARIKKGTHVGTKTAKRQAVARPEHLTFDLSKLDDEEYEILLSAAVLEKDDVEDDEDEDDEEETPRAKKSKKAPKSAAPDEDDEEDEERPETDTLDEPDDDEDEEDEDEDEDEDEEDEKPVSKKAKKAPKSKSTSKGVKLSRPVQRKKVSNSRRLELMLSEQRWETKRAELLREGVPPYVLDMAAPIMKSPDKLVIDLSDQGDNDADPKKVIEGILDELKGAIDLAPELGHAITTADIGRDEKGNLTDTSLALWEKEYGKP